MINLIINEISCACGGVMIPLGRQGENGVTQIEFALAPFIEKYGEGAALLLHQRSRDREPYPVSAAQDGNKLIWTVSNADTALAGVGKLEIQWFAGEKLAKSQMHYTSTQKSLWASDDPPEPARSWYAKLMEAIESAKGDPEAIKAAVEAYLEANPVEAPVTSVNGQVGDVVLDAEDIGALTAESLQAATNAALEQAKASGLFDGKDGITPTVSTEFVAAAGSNPSGVKVTIIAGNSFQTFVVYNGRDGVSGLNGITPKIQIGTVETLPAGSQATVSIGGTTVNPMLNFGIPKGDAGDGGTGYDDTNLREEVAKKYTKPSTGIPNSDLAPDVKASLGKADTALQAVPDIYQTTDAADSKYQKKGDYIEDLARVEQIANGKYSKPAGGIPASDLAEGVIPAAVTDDHINALIDAKLTPLEALADEILEVI